MMFTIFLILLIILKSDARDVLSDGWSSDDASSLVGVITSCLSSLFAILRVVSVVVGSAVLVTTLVHQPKSPPQELMM